MSYSARNPAKPFLLPVSLELPLITRALSSDDYELIVRQRPIAAKVFAGKEKGTRTSNDDGSLFLILS